MSYRTKVILSFLILYLVWGSTYLAIRVGVQDIPAGFFAGARFVPGGALMLLALAALGRRLRPRGRDWPVLIASAVLLLVTGNGFVILAEQSVPSGLAALIIATVPLWVAGLDAALPGGERLAPRGLAGLALGLVGLGVLSWPQLATTGDERVEPLGLVLLVVAALSWAIGTLLMRRRPIALDPLAITAWQMLIGGILHVLSGLLFQRDQPIALTPAALASIAYLIVFGSWLGLTAFVWLVHHVPAAKVTTYAYVNPAVALLLGWLILDERVDGFVLTGMVIILLSVALVNSARVVSGPPTTAELAAGVAPVLPETRLARGKLD